MIATKIALYAEDQKQPPRPATILQSRAREWSTSAEPRQPRAQLGCELWVFEFIDSVILEGPSSA